MKTPPVFDSKLVLDKYNEIVYNLYTVTEKQEIKNMNNNELLGYKIENMNDNRPGKVAYKLHGKRVTYTLVRMVNDPRFMFVMNSKNKVGSVKGNYTFTDVNNELRPYYAGAELL